MKQTRMAALLCVLALLCACGAPLAPTAPTAPTATPARTPAKAPAAAATSAARISRAQALQDLASVTSTDFELDALDGTCVKLSDFRGKIVFLSFFTTWCGYCLEEMPHFDAMMKDNDDVVVVAVQPAPSELQIIGRLDQGDQKAAEDKARALIEKEGYGFYVLLDRDGAVFDQPLYQSSGFPANYVIDREGVLRFGQPGMLRPQDMELLLAYLRALDEP